MSESASTISCPRCGATNRASARFCGGCGATFASEVSCPSCGSSNPPDGHFCDHCGQPLRAGARPPSPEAEPAATRSFGDGRYRVLRFLGEGGRKRVHLAEDTQLRREVAIGTFKSDGVDQTSLARARREAEAMARLSDHPNIVPIYDIGQEAGELYIVSQYMAGGDLDGLLAQAEGRRLAVDEAVRIATEVARALEHAHAHEVVHRDVKPGNVWLSPDGTAKLGDFGLAMALDGQRLTVEGATVGTVAYMSPEQGLGQPAGPRSDLYSLGALTYELLCGVPPFVGEDAASVISQHVSRAPVGPTWHRDDVPRALEQVVLRLLAKSPEERPESALKARQALEVVASASSVEEPVEDEALERLGGATFIGREAEAKELRAAVDEAIAGRGAMTMVVGEQGIGKTRLASEVEMYAELRGATVLWGRCTEREGAPAYWPWVQAIRAYVRGIDPDVLRAELGSGASDIGQIVSEVREQLPDLEEPQSLDAEQARFRLFDSVTSLLLNASQRVPLAIFLDDLHQADRSSLLLLEFLSRELATARILLLGTYREDDLDADHPLLEVHSTLSRERGYRRIRLRGLSERAVKELIEETAHQTLDSRNELALVEAVFRESEGNPFFIGEILRHLIESGTVYQSGDRWMSDVRRVEDLGIPDGIRDAVGRRLQRLSPDCRELLATASVIGREFTTSLLERLTGLEAAELMERLQEAIDGGNVQAAPDEVGGYAFNHLATRDALYEGLPAGRRVELHKALGEALEEIYESRIESHLGELAHHFAQAAPAGTVEKAADYSWWAAERATQLYAYEEAVSHYTRTLQLLAAADDDPTRRCELLLALGEAHQRAGEPAAAEPTYLEAAELAKRQSLPEHYARAALGYGGGPGGFSVADRAKEPLLELLRTALELLPARDSGLRVRLTSRLAVELHLYSHDPSEPDRLSRGAIEMADRIGDARILLLATYSRQWAIMGPDDLEDKVRAVDEVVRLARVVDDKEMEFRGHHLRLMALLQSGDIAGVDAEIRACTRLTKELRQPRYEWQVMSFRTMRALLQGRFQEGLRLAETALGAGQRGAGEVAGVNFGAHAFLGYWAEGRLDELKDGGAAFADAYPNSAWPSAFALLLAEIGELDEARRRLDALAADGFAGIRRDSNWLTAMATLSMVCQHLGDAAAGEQLYELLLPYADDFVPILYGAASLGSNHVFLGHAAHAAGRLDDAVRHYELALEAHERAGAPFLHPRINERLAETLLAKGDRDHAMEVLERGIEKARALGTALEAERMMALRLGETSLAGANVTTSIELVARSAEEDRPDLRSAAAPDGTVTIMFSDIEDSTKLTQSLGDQGWLDLLREHNAIIRERLREHGGYEVKARGDGFMLAFSSVRKAIQCAVDVQRALQEARERESAPPLRVRIGLHTGEALRNEADFFGTNVNLAARIGDLAEGDQILVSSVLHDLVVATGEFEFGPEREVELKGLNGTHRVFEVPWSAPPVQASSAG